MELPMVPYLLTLDLKLRIEDSPNSAGVIRYNIIYETCPR